MGFFLNLHLFGFNLLPCFKIVSFDVDFSEVIYPDTTAIRARQIVVANSNAFLDRKLIAYGCRSINIEIFADRQTLADYHVAKFRIAVGVYLRTVIIHHVVAYADALHERPKVVDDFLCFL